MYSNILAKDVWQVLQTHKNNDAIMVDVRTEYEWINQCVPKVKNIMFISFRFLHDMAPNHNFLTELEYNISKEQTIFFICRSGGRSAEACQIATQAAYQDCYNIIDGFEGSGFGPGWKNSKLPTITYSQAIQG